MEDDPNPDLTGRRHCWHLVPAMSVTIQLDLPDALVNEARANGLLNSAPLGDLISAELRRRRAAAELKQVLDDLRAQTGEPVSEADITAEIKAARKERRAPEAGR